MFQFLYYKHNTITKIIIYMHSIMDLTEWWEPLKIPTYMAPKVYNSNFKEPINL